MAAAILTEIKYNNLEEILYDPDGDWDFDGLYVQTNAMAGLVFASTWVAVVLGITRIISAKNDESDQRIFSYLV